jgi:demethylmenaquinone methyltransferase/2-methoxy-6-polyprenyl-1,4-benzoquinol methylase
MNRHNLLREQLDYYRARAGEYDASLGALGTDQQLAEQPYQREWTALVRAVRALRRCGSVLELAAGTGIWTQELLPLSSELTVVDGAPEMLAVNRARIKDPRVHYQAVDLFSWQPEREYDLVFFAFWLSHVPPELLDTFLDRVRQAVRPEGHVFIIDEPAGGQQLSGPSEGDLSQVRTLEDGRQFRVVKVYYDPGDIQERLRQRGLEPAGGMTGQSFFYLDSKRV